MFKYYQKKAIKNEKLLEISPDTAKYLLNSNFDGVDEFVKDAVFAVCEGFPVKIVVGENLSYKSLQMLATTKLLCENSLHCYRAGRDSNGYNSMAVDKNLFFANRYNSNVDHYDVAKVIENADGNRTQKFEQMFNSFISNDELTARDLFYWAIDKETEFRMSKKNCEIKSL